MKVETQVKIVEVSLGCLLVLAVVGLIWGVVILAERLPPLLHAIDEQGLKGFVDSIWCGKRGCG